MRHLLIASVFFAVTSPAFAETDAAPAADSEQLSQDLLKSVDNWIGQVNEKLQSDKPVTPEDFDSVFNDSFFSGSEDPIRDIELAQKRMNEKLGGAKNNLDAPYNKWVTKKLSAADLSPEVISDKARITVRLKTPAASAGAMKINIDRTRIKLSYAEPEAVREIHPDGSVTSSSVMRRRQRVMPVPKGADPDKYRVKTAKGSVSIIFDRLNKKNSSSSRQEASK